MHCYKQPILNGVVLVAGDLHGKLHSLTDKLDKMNWPGDHVICLGDIGLGFPNVTERLEHLNSEAEAHNNHIWLIRGNHDNPSEWKKEHVYSNVHFLQDNTTILINNLQWYVIGGSVSIDRVARTQGEDWWEDEEINFDMPQHLDCSKIYGILSHVGPTPPGISMSLLDYYMRVSGYLIKDPLEREKETLQKMMEALSPVEWYFGHFHLCSDFTQATCKCYCLDELVLRQMELR